MTLRIRVRSRLNALARCHITALSDNPFCPATVTVTRLRIPGKGVILSWNTPAPNALHDVIQPWVGQAGAVAGWRPNTRDLPAPVRYGKWSFPWSGGRGGLVRGVTESAPCSRWLPVRASGRAGSGGA